MTYSGIRKNTVSTEINKNLKITFKEHNLSLISTIMSTENRINTLPFPDVVHIFTKENRKKKLQPKFYLSYSNKFFLLKWQIISSLYTFKWIITGGEKRMKRWNEIKRSLCQFKKNKTKCIAPSLNL